MQVVEQYVIDRADPRYALIDAEAFKAKNLTMRRSMKRARRLFIIAGTSSTTRWTS